MKMLRVASIALGISICSFATTIAQTQGEKENTSVQQQPINPVSNPEEGKSYADIAIEAQKKLKDLGYYESQMDGIVGPKTRAAIIEFQRDLDLPLTGQLDKETIDYLSRPTLILNTQDSPPFQYHIQGMKGKVHGPVPDVIRVVCIEAKLNCILRLYEWKAAQELVQAGKAHGLFTIGWNAERAKSLHRSLPIIESEYGFFVRDDDPLDFQQVSDLDGYTVGVYGPSNTSRTLQSINSVLKNRNMQIHIKETRDDKPLYKELSEGQGIQAVFSNRDSGNTVINGLGLNNIRYAGRYQKLLYYVGFSKSLVNETVVDRFNKALQKIQENGNMREIYANSGLMGKYENDNKEITKKAAVEKENTTVERYEAIVLEDKDIIVDRRGCLMWQKSGSERQVNWNEAKSYVESLNNDRYAGYSDWRLPKINELVSLLESDIRRENRLYIHPLFDAMQQTCWSADVMHGTLNTEIQFVDFYDGNPASKDQSDTNFIRAVRDMGCEKPGSDG